MNLKRKVIFLFLLLFMFVSKVSAASYSLSNAVINVNGSSTVNLSVSGIVQSVGGTIVSSDTSCVKITAISGLSFGIGGGETAKTKVNSDIGKFSFMLDDPVNLNAPIVKVSITGLRECSTSLEIVGGLISDGNPEQKAAAKSTITVNAKEVAQTSSESTNQIAQAPTTDNNSSSNSNSSNSSNITNPQTNNSSKSDNNNLSSLSVSGFNLDKVFNANTLNYSISVGKDVNSISINAKAADSHAKVSVSGAKSLRGGTNNVKVLVTAENGSRKTYTIVVNKEKDPNAPDVEENVENNEEEEEVIEEVVDDNYLKNIKPSVGILSPKFDQNTLNYVIYLPYEESKITFETELLNSDNSTINVDGPENLEIGNNVYEFTLSSKDGNTRKYTVLVKRANIFGDFNNTLLKSISLNNGSLYFLNGNEVKDFDKNVTTYYYKKGDNFSYNFVAEDENAIVTSYENDGVISIIVESPNGDFKVYTLIPYKSNMVKYVIILSGGFIVGYFTRLIYRKLWKKSKKKKILKNQLKQNL